MDIYGLFGANVHELATPLGVLPPIVSKFELQVVRAPHFRPDHMNRLVFAGHRLHESFEMNFPRTRMLTVAPVIVAAMATSAIAQNSDTAFPQLSRTQLVNATADAGFRLKMTVPRDGTYVFTAPAGSGLSLRLGGETILDGSSGSADAGSFIRAFMTLTAGTHMLEASGGGIAGVSANLLGMPPSSLSSITERMPGLDANTTSPINPGAIVSGLMNGQGSSSFDSTSIIPSLFGSGTSANRPSLDMPFEMPNVDSDAPRRPLREELAAFLAENGQGRPNTGGSPRGLVREVFVSSMNGSGLLFGGRGRGGSNDPGGPVIGSGEAASSQLSPPSGVALTEAVQITGGATRQGVVASTGQTLFGGVMDPMTYDTVSVTIAPSNRTTTVDVAPMSGQFAVRLFPEDLRTGGATVTVTGVSSADATVATMPVSYDYTSGRVVDGVSQALSRLTYGPTADLYSRVRSIGFSNYVNAQLQPSDVGDAEFNSMNFGDLVSDLPDNFNTVANAEMSLRMAHAGFSNKQLREVMGDFWSNHFHASTKDTRVYEQNILDRRFFRQNAFGNFEDLLLYSARSPLMSQFLDNDQSRVGNLNENYGREILELHTVGVDGGYGDEDVIAVSRVFTGWNFVRTNPDEQDVLQEYAFDFRADRHDTEDKFIPFLNTTIAGRSEGAGVREGEELISILSDDPRTHNYVCGKIVQRFVADDPPASFVQACADAWVASNGNAGEMLRAILLSPDYISNVELQRNKAKTPYEYSVSVMRALGAEPDGPADYESFFRRFYEASRDGGYEPLRFSLPTGLPEVGDAWISSASMIGSYREVTEIVERRSEYNIDLQADIEAAGVETAEEVAAYLLTIATADRYTLEEYEAMVSVLKGEDGIFEPMMRDERSAFDRAAGLLVVLPSFLLQ